MARASVSGNTPRLRAQVLGPVVLDVEDATVRLGGPTPRAIFAMLLLDANRVVSLRRLIDGVWGVNPPATAPGTVQSHVSRLRRALRTHGVGTILTTQAPGYRIDVADDELDLLRFQRDVTRARADLAKDRPAAALQALDDALASWSGAPVADLADFPFAPGAAASLAEARVAAEEARNDCLLALGDVAGLVPRLRGLIDRHPLRERLRHQMMVALYHAGRHTDALDEFHSLRHTLDEELGLTPGPAINELQRRILAHDVPALRPRSSLRATDGDLAARNAVAGRPRERADTAATSARDQFERPDPPIAVRDELVGRHDELRAILARLAQGVRLVTVTGPGGAGKTRLAMEVASRWGHGEDLPATVVALDSLDDPGLVTTRVARAFGLRGQPSLAVIADLLADRRQLLVLDNMEHVLASAPDLSVLLERAPGLTILATSQVPLRIAGEHEVAVPPLPVTSSHNPDLLRVNDAVRLFLVRARARVASFPDDDATIRDVAAVVRLLDGMPLAIELAAARVKVLAPGAMLDLLGRGLDVVADPGRPGADRRRTLGATIAWSVDLLPAELQRVLAALSILAGRFDLADAAAVTGLGSQDVIVALEQLVDHSLVQRYEDHGEFLFGLLRTIRMFAHGRLDDDAALRDEVRRRRDDHFVRVTGERSDRMVQEVDTASTAWLRRHVDDLRAVLDGAWSRGDAAVCTALSASLAMFWGFVQSAEGRRWMERALAATPSPDADQRARLHTGLARMCMFGGPLDVAADHARAALAAVEEGARAHSAVLAHNVLGQVAAARERPADADAHAARAMELAEGSDGSDLLAIVARNSRVDMLLRFESWDEAAAASLEVLDLLQGGELTVPTEHEVFALSNLGLARIQQGDVAAAMRWFGALAEATRQVATPVGGVMVLLGHAAIAVRAGAPPDLARGLVGTAVRRLERNGSGLGVPEQRLLDEVIAALDDEHGQADRLGPGEDGLADELVKAVRAAIEPA